MRFLLLLLFIPALVAAQPEQPRRIIVTDQAPAPVGGVYSQAVVVGHTCYVAGQIGLQVQPRQLIGPSAEAQARQALTNIRAILTAAGFELRHVTKATVFLTDMNDFATLNTVWREFFATDPPARETVQVVRIPMEGARVEISVIAAR